MKNKKTFLFALAFFIFSKSGLTADPVAHNPNIFVELSKKLVPSVVNISTVMNQPQGSYGGSNSQDMLKKFFEDFFGGNPPGGNPLNPPTGKTPRAMALGTGFIIDADGLILTNNHVVNQADEIKIQFTEDSSEEQSDGEVVGRDPELDLALIKVKSKEKRKLVAVTFGDSDALQVGEYVMAIGNPFGQGHSVTHGIISAKDRPAPNFLFSKYLQTDAPINPGNSGGPLVNLKGEVIGINNAIDARAQGIGFAIPINAVKKVLSQLKTKGSVARGYIGVLVNELTPEIASKIKAPKDLKAPFVANVNSGQPAEKAGIKPYDVILEFNGKKIKNASELIEAVTEIPVGDSVPVKVLRTGREKSLKIKIAERPSNQKKSQPKISNKKDSKHKTDVGMSLEELNDEIREDLNLDEKVQGVVVSEIGYDGFADKAGLTRGDVILEVDQKPIQSIDDFFVIVKEKKSYLLRIRRLDGEGRDVFMVIVLNLSDNK